MAKTAKPDIYKTVSEKIASLIEKGDLPWQKRFETGAPLQQPLRHHGVPYQGINTLLLWAAAMERGFTSPYWMTFKQAKEMGASVVKGAKSEIVVYVGRVEKESDQIDPSTGEPVKVGVHFMKQYRVFNTSEIEGLAEHYYPKPRTSHHWDREADAEAFFAYLGATIRHGEPTPYYNPADDYVNMPDRESFVDAGAYYSTLAHEVAHWTGHQHRLDRLRSYKARDREYATEELVAELSAAFTMAHLGTSSVPLQENARYIASWAQALREDHRVIFKVASAAQKATDFLIAKQPDVLQFAAE